MGGQVGEKPFLFLFLACEKKKNRQLFFKHEGKKIFISTV